MGTTGQRKLRRPDTKASKFAVFEKDAVSELSDARKLFVKKTGGKLRDVKTAGAYKKLSAADKKRYRKLNPDDFDLINLARLIKRYQNFIGEKDLKADLEKILTFWKISEESLFSKTRIIWSNDFSPNNRSDDLVGSGFDTSN